MSASVALVLDGYESSLFINTRIHVLRPTYLHTYVFSQFVEAYNTEI